MSEAEKIKKWVGWCVCVDSMMRRFFFFFAARSRKEPKVGRRV